MAKTSNTKLPEPSILREKIEKGMSALDIMGEYGVQQLSSLRRYCQRHGLPLPRDMREVNWVRIHRVSSKREDKPEPPVATARRFPQPDARRVVVERPFAASTTSSTTPWNIKISLPRLTFLHGEFKG